MAGDTGSKSSTTERARGAQGDTVRVGRVVRAHGVAGGVLIAPESDNSRRFAGDAELWLERAGEPAQRLRIAASRRQGGLLWIRFAGIDDRDAAAALAGAELTVPRAALPAPAPGSFYEGDLVGCRCRDRRAGALGEVQRLIADGGGHLLLIADGRRELLVPFAERFLLAVDLERRSIDLDLPEGLLEACTSPS